MADIGATTDNATLADLLAEIIRDDVVFTMLAADQQDAVIEAEQRIRELPDEED